MAKLIGIAFKRQRRGEVETTGHTHISVSAGIANDRIGSASKRRQITVLRAEDWAAAVADVGAELPWTVRRANLLVEGLPTLASTAGQYLNVGCVKLLITGECDPCSRMGEIHIALPDALTPEWRGGLTCTVIDGGDIAIGDNVEIVCQAEQDFTKPEHFTTL